MLKSLETLLEEARKNVEDITHEELKRALDAGEKIVLVDVREPSEWEQGTLPGAIPVPRGILELNLPRFLPDPSAAVVCYCQGGVRSLLAAESLKRLGYQNVRSLAGGFHAWVSKRAFLL